MSSIEIQLSGEALAVLPRLKDEAGAGLAVAREMDYQNQLTIARIQRGHLSGPTSDSTLSVRTNRLRGSVRASKAVPTGAAVVSSIGSNVSYAAIHEFGGVIHRTVQAGIIRVKTNKRGQLIRQGKNGKLLVFAGRKTKYSKAMAAKGASWDINMPARAPFGHGIADRADEYGAGISQAIVDFWGGKKS